MFQPGEGPSRGLLRDCTTSPINRFAALGERQPGPHRPGLALHQRHRHPPPRELHLQPAGQRGLSAIGHLVLYQVTGDQ